MSLKLMKRDMETNGSGGGAMNPIEGAGVQKSQVSHITIWIVCDWQWTFCCLCCDWSHLSFIHVDDAEYLENRMGLTITSVWRLFVFDIENVLDGVRCW